MRINSEKELLKLLKSDSQTREAITEPDLRGNQLSSLPPDIAKLQNLTLLDLQDNFLLIPPEILGISEISLGNPEEILNYFFSLNQTTERPLNEAKMLLVGQGKVGKTSLIRRLINSPDTFKFRTTE